jgi:hypothetical protein
MDENAGGGENKSEDQLCASFHSRAPGWQYYLLILLDAVAYDRAQWAEEVSFACMLLMDTLSDVVAKIPLSVLHCRYCCNSIVETCRLHTDTGPLLSPRKKSLLILLLNLCPFPTMRYIL